MSTNKWSQEDVAALRKLAAAGRSARQIGKKLSRTDRAILNKAHKLGIRLKDHSDRPADARSTAAVRCPFFDSFRRGGEIRCEGIGAAARIVLLFESEADWKQTVRTHCDRAWEDCPVAKMLGEKYK